MQPAISTSAEVIDTLAKACAYGDLERLRQFVDADPGCVNKGDESGYFPLQWAALNNRVAETSFLLSRGAAPNAADHTGQTALHWGAVRGSLPVIETLLRHAADYELRDNRGYTAAHVAAQYGQTAVLYHLALKWGIDIDTQDNDGRTALHWAAYKGFADTIRLLVVLDARYTLPDKEGCTPLHWAAIKGNGEACTVLLQGGSVSVLSYKDSTGATPPQLALDKGHRQLGHHLKEYKQRGGSQEVGGWCGRGGRCGWLTATQLCPIIWVLIIALVALFIHKVMMLPHAPLSATEMAWAWTVPIVSGIGLVFLYKTTSSDPGFIPTGWDTSGSGKRDGGSSAISGGSSGHHHGHKRSLSRGPDPELGLIGSSSNATGSSSITAVTGLGGGGSNGFGRTVSANHLQGGGGGGSSLSKPLLSSQHKHLDSPALWAGNWQQLCVSCRIVRPLRAKHDSVTDRCIEVFDHYCPWVGNAIGKGNRHLFVLFLWLELYAQTASAVLGAIQVQRHINGALWEMGDLLGLIIFMVLDVFVGISVAALAIAQASQLGRNVTTNELANWHRYKYLQTPDGGYTNPFNKGCKDNCWEAFHPEQTGMAPVFFTNSSAAGSKSTAKSCCGGH